MEGQLHLSMRQNLYKKESWKIDWTPDFIFPGMKKDYKVRMQIEQGKRGEIYDSGNGKGLATNGKATEVGIIPEETRRNSGANKRNSSYSYWICL